MSYRDTIRQLSINVPKDIVPDFTQPRKRGKKPTQASSDFAIHREQGDWAERIILAAINKINKHFVAVQYGKSDKLEAGEAGFGELFDAYQDELEQIGKRPDILIFRLEDYRPNWNFNISNLDKDEQVGVVPRAIAGLEIRSSAFLTEGYQLYRQHQTALLGKKKNPSREFLSFTPKVEDLLVVYKWIQFFDVPHYYFQVFFDRVYGISFEQILRVISDPTNRNTKYFIERDTKNQQKSTIKIDVREGVEIAYRVEMPEHRSVMKQLGRGRLLFHVTFEGGEAFLNADTLFGLLNLPSGNSTQ